VNKLYSIFTVRFVIILFWITVIAAFLFSSVLPSYFATPAQSINVYTWVDIVDEEAVAAFEKETGIKVHLSYYEHNQELLAKFQLTGGKDYDLVMISDYMIEFLIHQGLIKPLRKDAFQHWDLIEERLLNHPFDPHNSYSIPLFWDLYGIGYNKKLVGQQGLPVRSWQLIFDPAFANQRISMVDEANEAIMIAAQYLYGNVMQLSPEQQEAVKKLLIEQKPRVEAYTDLRAGYLLLSGAISMAVGQSAFVCKAIEADPATFGFMVPDEGSFMVIDSMVIPAASTKDALVYQFINFIFAREIMRKVINKFAYLPVRTDLLQEMHLACVGNAQQIIDYLKKAKLFVPIISREAISHLWMEVKAY